MRIVITGPPQSGKSTVGSILSAVFGIPLWQTDSLLPENLEWSEYSRRVAEWFDRPGDWIIEGVVVPRAVRKWMAMHPTVDPPFDKFILLREPQNNLVKLGQQTMGKQVIALSEELLQWISPSKSVQLDASFAVLSSAKKSPPPKASSE
jgi:adenylate kinase family enzyme